MSKQARRLNSNFKHRRNMEFLAEMVAEQKHEAFRNFEPYECGSFLWESPEWRFATVDRDVRHFIDQVIRYNLSFVEVVQYIANQGVQFAEEVFDLLLGLRTGTITIYWDNYISEAEYAVCICNAIAPYTSNTMELAAGLDVTDELNISISTLIEIGRLPERLKRRLGKAFRSNPIGMRQLVNNCLDDFWAVVDYLDSSKLKASDIGRAINALTFGESVDEQDNSVIQFIKKENRHLNLREVWNRNYSAMALWRESNFKPIGAGYYESINPDDYNIYDDDLLAEKWLAEQPVALKEGMEAFNASVLMQ